jgi:Cu(I)/Ag(I) efflux system membrane fusion protein
MRAASEVWLGVALGAIAGIAIGALLTVAMVGGRDGAAVPAAAGGGEKPLYWVAPMDPDYRRDRPGKSPMGMDLIPVYAEGGEGADAGPGTIRIAPEVVNNLGVRTARVSRKSLHSTIRTVGYVQYDQDRLVHIHPRVDGWIEKLHVKAAGDPVVTGQPLYELYSPALVNAQEELVLALNRDNRRLVGAAVDRLRALQLSDDFIEALKKRRQVRQSVTFFAPQAGVVDNLNIREGFFVNPGTTLMSIGALDDVWVEAEVFERQAALVKVGMPVTMTLDYLPGREWRGSVDYVYPSLDEKTRTLRARLRFENPDGELKPNMFAQVVLHASDDDGRLIVPREAVIRTGNQNRVVLALGEGHFKSVAVTLGRLDEESAELLDGVREGDEVVTSAQFLLDSESSKRSDFLRMQPQDEQPAAVWTRATILGVMPEQRMVSARHEAIAEWDWPVMTMDFAVDDAVDFDALQEGVDLHVEISRRAGGEYAITAIHVMKPEESPGAESGGHGSHGGAQP